MQFHEIANIFPLLDGAEFKELVDDIAVNGLIDPITVFKNKIIDGRNRYRACLEAGVEPIYEQWKQNGASLTEWIIAKNLHRRHLNSGQKAMCATDALPWLEKEAQARKVALSGSWANDDEVVQKVAQPEKGKSRDKAAELFGTNKQYVQDAKKIRQERPDLADQVRAGKITIADAKREVKREEIVKNLTIPKPPNSKSHVILIDPPWRYDFSATNSRVIENHYPTMTGEELAEFDIDSYCESDCVMFMWTTSPKLAESIDLMRVWNFNYRTCMVWVKDKIGMGYYARQRHEILLIGTRGSLPVPKPENRPDSVIEANRTQHSKKPEELYGLIEKMYPEFSKIEIFAREERPGWKSFGNQL